MIDAATTSFETSPKMNVQDENQTPIMHVSLVYLFSRILDIFLRLLKHYDRQIYVTVFGE